MQGAIWRRWLWRRGVGAAVSALGGQPRARWLGWRLDLPGGRVEWFGGLNGPATRVVIDGEQVRREGLLGADDVARLLSRR